MKQIFRLKNIIFFFLFAIITIYACNSNKQSKTVSQEETLIVDNEFYFSKIDSLVNIYNRDEYLTYYDKKLIYPVEDSLSSYLSKLDRKTILNNSRLKFIMGKLLEKQYLEIRNSGMFPKESFPVYNMSLVSYNDESSRFALNFILNGKVGEFVCIDSVVLILDKLPQMKNDTNHQKCMYLVKNNMTGGCKW